MEKNPTNSRTGKTKGASRLLPVPILGNRNRIVWDNMGYKFHHIATSDLNITCKRKGDINVPSIRVLVTTENAVITMSQSLMKTSATRNSPEKTATVLATSLRSQRSEAIILQLQD